mgnify:CR=1 FL=1
MSTDFECLRLYETFREACFTSGLQLLVITGKSQDVVWEMYVKQALCEVRPSEISNSGKADHNV